MIYSQDLSHFTTLNITLQVFIRLKVKVVLHEKPLQEDSSRGMGAIGILTVSLTLAQPEMLCKGAGRKPLCEDCFRDTWGLGC